MSSDSNTATDTGAPSRFALQREIAGLSLLSVGICLFLALVSFEAPGAENATNLIGPVGATIADVLFEGLGVAAFCLDALVCYVGFSLLVGFRVDWNPGEAAGYLLFVLGGTVAAHLGLDGYRLFGHVPGGIVGSFSAESLRAALGTVGASIVAGSAMLTGFVLSTRLSIGGLVRGVLKQCGRASSWVKHRWKMRKEFKKRLAQARENMDDMTLDDIQAAAEQEAQLSATDLFGDDVDVDDKLEDKLNERLSERLAELVAARAEVASDAQANDNAGGSPPTAPDAAADDSADDADDSSDADDAQDWSMQTNADTSDEPDVVVHGTDDESDEQNTGPDTMQVDDGDIVDISTEGEPDGDVDADFGPDIVESEAQRENKKRAARLEEEDDGLLFEPKSRGNYDLPPLSFLDYDSNEVGIDTEALRGMANKIEQTLENFNIEGNVVEICPGPVITMFEFKPAPGTKISKISNREADLTMELAAKSVRIVAPIPGKSVVGVEVSNPDREMVWLKEVLADDSFQSSDMDLPLALGKGTSGEIETVDLASMPHLLVAGATGSGKSVAINSMICSLLYAYTPEELQMVMIDPKVLELSVYNGIPHLHLPVVTDPKKATVALNWAVEEMERRYQKLADMGVRDINSYNDKVRELTEQAELDQQQGKEESEALSELGVDKNGNPDHTPFPYQVIVIDEFADLMMTASKEVESAVARLAQKARAAGIHMILATQRPSTDVITGMIKANFPARLALQVSSNTDSRVILGSNGAENLLGNGDMLMLPPGSSDLQRVHGAFVSDGEIEDVVSHWKEQAEDPDYNDDVLTEEEEDQEDVSPLDREMEKDEYYEDAVRLVVEKSKASISMLQRRLRVGYNRAARMVEMMEEDGFVGSSEGGGKARKVLVDEVPFDNDDDEEDAGSDTDHEAA
jgi:S-DNA-T family DNA segregation ATPase FtsK/SpoIIIE